MLNFNSKEIRAFFFIALLAFGLIATAEAKKDFSEELADAKEQASSFQKLAKEAEKFRNTALTGDFNTLQNNLFFAVERLSDISRNAGRAAKTLEKAWKKDAPAKCAKSADKDVQAAIKELETIAEKAQSAADLVLQDARARLTQQQFQDEGHGAPSMQQQILRGYVDQLALPVKELETRGPGAVALIDKIEAACKE